MTKDDKISNLKTGIKTIIVETDENSKKSLQARMTDNGITLVKEFKSVWELIETDNNIENVLFELKSFKKDEDLNQTNKKDVLDLIWNRIDILKTIGKAVESDVNVGVLIENPDASFNKFFETLKRRYKDIKIQTFKKMSATVKTDDLKTVITDALDGGYGDVSLQDKENMLKNGELVSVTDWPLFVNKITQSVTDGVWVDNEEPATNAYASQ